MSRSLRRDGLLAAVSAAATTALWRALRRPGLRGAGRWERTNHAGHPVTLLEGVALVCGATVTAAAGAALGGPSRPLAATALAAAGAGAVGAVDDLRQDRDRKGLAGHLGALAHGHVTTGALKILVLSGTGLAASAVLGPGPATGSLPGAAYGARAGSTAYPRTGREGAAVLLGGAVIAGSANLANLLDLRPGRTLKAGLLGVLPLLSTGHGSVPGAVALGVGAAVLRDDLRGISMLGDTGANPWGALVGLALVERTGLAGRAVALGVLATLTLLSERVSFTRVIEATPVLRELDRLGRLPAHDGQ